MYYTSNTNPRKLEIHFYLKDVVLHYLQSTTKQKMILCTDHQKSLKVNMQRNWKNKLF